MFVVRSGFLLERGFVSKRNSGSKIDLEKVQDPQDTLEAQTETREDSQGVVEVSLKHKGQRSSDRTRSQFQRCGGH